MYLSHLAKFRMYEVAVGVVAASAVASLLVKPVVLSDAKQATHPVIPLTEGKVLTYLERSTPSRVFEAGTYFDLDQ